MVGDSGEIEELFAGQAVKVLTASDAGDDLWIVRRDDQTARVSLAGPSDLAPGDIVLLGQDRWEHVHAEAWTEETAIAVVRALVEEQLLIEGSSSSSRVISGPVSGSYPGSGSMWRSAIPSVRGGPRCSSDRVNEADSNP